MYTLIIIGEGIEHYMGIYRLEEAIHRVEIGEFDRHMKPGDHIQILNPGGTVAKLYSPLVGWVELFVAERVAA